MENLGQPSLPDFEANVQLVYEAVLSPGETAVDVGAHVGRHAFPMGEAVWPGGRVYALEPLPECRREFERALKEERSRLQNVMTLMSEAVGEARGKGEFVVAVDALGFSGLKERVYDVPTTTRRIAVVIRTLDDLFGELPSLRYVKIDAEGGEYHVLRGGMKCLARFRPLVTFEFGENSIGEYGITPADMANLWDEAGYRLLDINGVNLTAEAFVESSHHQRVWDYVAIPGEQPELRAKLSSLLGG